MLPAPELRRIGARERFTVSLRLTITHEIAPSALADPTRAHLGRAGCSHPQQARPAALSNSIHIGGNTPGGRNDHV